MIYRNVKWFPLIVIIFMALLLVNLWLNSEFIGFDTLILEEFVIRTYGKAIRWSKQSMFWFWIQK